jgi:hypothetical protein
MDKLANSVQRQRKALDDQGKALLGPLRALWERSGVLCALWSRAHFYLAFPLVCSQLRVD